MRTRWAVAVTAIGLLATLLAAGFGLGDRAFASGSAARATGAHYSSTTGTAADGSNSIGYSYSDKEWPLRQIRLPVDWTVRSSPDVIVAVLDTGIDSNDKELAGKVAAEVNFTDSPTTNDVNGHGTQVAGIIAASTNNTLGITGIAPNSRLLNVKVADDDGSCSAEAVARGIVWAVDHGADIINISLELRDPSIALEQAIDYAWSRGALIVAAAGNDASTAPVYPAYYADTIAVSAIGPDDALAPLSNHGDWVDVAAPGFDIYSTLPGDKYGYETGTSFAAAYVSGLAALAFSAAADENGDERLNVEVRSAIEDTCDEINAPGVGHGLVDAARLFRSGLLATHDH